MLSVYEKIQQLHDDIATLKAEFQLMRISVTKLRADLEDDAEYFDDKFIASADELEFIRGRMTELEMHILNLRLKSVCSDCLFLSPGCGNEDT